MDNRFVITHDEIVETEHFSYHVKIYRDKQTGMMYLETNNGLTPLLDQNGKPMGTSYKVNI